METKRYNEGKPDYTLIDFKSLLPLVEILTYWTEKYERDNWKLWGEKMSEDEIKKSLARHTLAYLDGEDTDPESWVSHIGHIMANCMFIQYHKKDSN